MQEIIRKPLPEFDSNNKQKKRQYNMKDFQDLILNRRSYRRFTDEPVSAEDVQKILAAGLLAPTSKNKRAWEFVVVEDKDMLQRLSQCKPAGAQSIANAAFAVAVTVDATVSDAWVEDASVAASFMQLQAADLGLGSCWIQVRGRFDAADVPSEEYVQEALGIPETFPVLCILVFGHKSEARKPLDPEKILWEKVHIGNW